MSRLFKLYPKLKVYLPKSNVTHMQFWQTQRCTRTTKQPRLLKSQLTSYMSIMSELFFNQLMWDILALE